MDSVWNSNLNDLLNEVASDRPTPGGGSVSMVAAALGAGLIIMALEVSAKKKNAPPEISDRLKELRELMAALKTAADADIAVFNAYMAARNLPQETPEEKAIREEMMALALRDATAAPIEAAENILKALEIGEQAAVLSHIGIVSDVGAGAALLEGALRAGLLSVDINFPWLKDKDFADSALRRRGELAAEGKKRAQAIADAVGKRLSSRG